MRFKEFASRNGGSLNELVSLPPSIIQVEPGFNPRLDDERTQQHIRELANSIIASGYDQTQVIVVRWVNDQVFVRDGHCRLAAIKLAAEEGTIIERVPVKPMEKGADEADEAFAVLTTQNKLPLSPFEFATQVKKLISYGKTEAEIARRLGKSRTFIDNALMLAGSAREIREDVIAGTISSTEAVKVIRAHRDKAVEVIADAKEIVRKEGKTRVTASAIERAAAPRTERVSLATLATRLIETWDAALEGDAWNNGGANAVTDAINAIRNSLGPLRVPVSVTDSDAEAEAKNDIAAM